MWHKLALRLPALVVLAVLVAVIAGAAFTIRTGRSELQEQSVVSTQRKLDGYLNGVQQYLLRAHELLEFSGGHITSGASVAGPGLGAGESAEEVADGLLRTSAVFDYLMLIDDEGGVNFVRRPSRPGRR